MGAKEEEDVDAGTPVDGKKLTFAERRELERKKKEARARDADPTAGREVAIATRRPPLVKTRATSRRALS